MESREYELIIYIGIAEYSQDLKGYIEMEQLKALDKHINKNMFYTRLCRSIETIANKFNTRLQRDLEVFKRFTEMDRQAPEGQKLDYPKELPTIYSFGFPLVSLTGGKYFSQVYFNDIEAFAKAIDEINNTIQPTKQVQANTDNSNTIEFQPKLFKDLFIKPELIDKCLNLLRETDKPCINDEGKYLRNKGAFVVWFIALQDKKMFNQSFTNDIERAETLNFNFEDLNISESLFRQPNRRATDSYKKHFEVEISAKKH
jgi:hypothetical protein